MQRRKARRIKILYHQHTSTGATAGTDRAKSSGLVGLGPDEAAAAAERRQRERA